MKHKITLLFLLLTTISFAQIPSYVPSNGLVGWWPFNGNANDESGNGNNGTVNGATLTTDRFGIADKAYSFSSSIININNNFFDNGWASFTISVWVKSNDVTISSQNIYNTYPHDGEGFGLNHPNAPGKLSYWKNSNINVHSWDIFSANPLNYTNFQNDVWYHLLIKKENSTYTFYVNGSIDKVSTATISALNQTCGLNFGSIGGAEYFQGSLDDFGIWNRALTDCEIHDLFTSQLGSSNTYSSESQSAIDSYTWPVNGQTYTQSGVYTDTLVNAAGCDSVITLNLELDFTGIQSHTHTSLQLYPNPVKDIMTLVGLKGEAVSFAVYSVDGKLIKSSQTSGEIQLEDLKKGNYILKIENEALPFVKL